MFRNSIWSRVSGGSGPESGRTQGPSPTQAAPSRSMILPKVSAPVVINHQNPP